jgi:hypothetical protein
MACRDTNGAQHLRAREERYADTTIFLPQKCHPRPLHTNYRAGSANLGGNQIPTPMRIWSKGGVGIHACTLREMDP